MIAESVNGFLAFKVRFALVEFSEAADTPSLSSEGKHLGAWEDRVYLVGSQRTAQRRQVRLGGDGRPRPTAPQPWFIQRPHAQPMAWGLWAWTGSLLSPFDQPTKSDHGRPDLPLLGYGWHDEHRVVVRCTDNFVAVVSNGVALFGNNL